MTKRFKIFKHLYTFTFLKNVRPTFSFSVSQIAYSLTLTVYQSLPSHSISF